MRLTTPSDGPLWLPRFADSIITAFKSVMDAPFRLWRVATADQPMAADYTGALDWDSTVSRIAYSNGTTWFTLQPYDATLAGIAGLPSTLGLLEQTATDVFGIRLIGVANATDVLTRAGGDGRYALVGSGVLSFNTRTGAVTLTSGDVTTALTYTPTSVTGLTGSQSVAAFKTGLSLVKGDVGLGSVDNTADAAKAVLSATKWTTARNLAGNSVDGSAAVAFANKFIVQGTTDAGLSGAQFLGALSTGILKNTTTTGVLSIAVAADFPTLNQNTTGSAAKLTTARTIAGNSFDGTANISINDTDLSGAAWTTYTPTIAAGSGTFTTTATEGRYRKIGKSVLFWARVAITANGTAGTQANIGLPVASAAVGAGKYQFAVGMETDLTGNLLRGAIGSGEQFARVKNYDNTYPGADGRVLVIQGSYEAA